MRRFAIAVTLALVACGGAPPAPNTSSGPPELTEYPAAVFAGDRTTYLFAAHTVAQGQRALRDTIDSLGTVVGGSTDQLAKSSIDALGFDWLGPELGAKLGVDLGASVAVFSDGMSPTIVMRANHPEIARAFFQHIAPDAAQLIVGGTPVFTLKTHGDIDVGWAIDGDWLWLHFGLSPERDPNAGWFTAHHARESGPSPAAPAWLPSFALARKLAAHAEPVIGLWRNREVIKKFLAATGDDTWFRDIIDCIGSLAVVDHVEFAIDGDGHHTSAKLALELEPVMAAGLDAARVPPPPGFTDIAKAAALAVQVNLDVARASQAFASCFRIVDLTTDKIDAMGVRGGRAALLSLDPDKHQGTGVVALDLTEQGKVHKLIDEALDEVPQRSLFERDHAFGAHKGKHLAVPLLGSIDYVTESTALYAAMGDGLLDQLVGPAAAPADATPPSPPLVELDVRPPALDHATWQWLWRQVGSGRESDMLATLLERWRDLHLALTLDHGRLVLDASGDRR